MSFYISAVITSEILIILFAAFSQIRKYIDSLAEAYVYASILILSIFSVSIQYFFLFGIYKFFPIIDFILIVISIYILFRNRQILFNSYRSFKKFCKINPFFTFLFATLFFCLFIRGFLLPPASYDSLTYHLARVLMMQNDGSYFLQNFGDYRQDIMPIGYDVLHFLYLRFYTDYGLATFGFLSYTIVIAGIFACVTKLFSDNKLSKIICFITASLTMFLLNATSTLNDLILAAVTIACILSAHNFFKDRNGIHLFMLFVALTFGSDVKFIFGAFLLPFLFFYTLLLLKEIGFRSLIPWINKNNLRNLPFFILPLSIIPLILTILIHNYAKYGFLMGPDFFSAAHTGNLGLWGKSINFVRYFIEVIDLPKEAGGGVLNTFYDLVACKYKLVGLFPGIHSVQLVKSLYTDASFDEGFVWYGLLGLPIVISIIFTMLCGRGFLRVVAISIVSFVFVITLQLLWAPWMGRFFALAFAGGMMCFAFMLKWIEKKSVRASHYIVRLALLISTLNLSYYAYVNFIHSDQLLHQIKNRNIIYSKFFYPPEAFNLFIEKIPPKSKILLITGANSRIFPFFLRRPDLNITVTGVPDAKFSGSIHNDNTFDSYKEYKETFKLNGQEYRLSKRKDFKTIQKSYDFVIPIDVPPYIWEYYSSR